MFNILIHKGNAKQNITEIPSHPSQNVYHEENNQTLVRMKGGKGSLIHCFMECKLQPLWKAVWRVFKKRKIELPYDPAMPLLGIFS
jgi:hypothetical protein